MSVWCYMKQRSGHAYSWHCSACWLHIQVLWATLASILWAKVMHIHSCRLGRCVAMRPICCRCSSWLHWTSIEQSSGLMSRSQHWRYSTVCLVITAAVVVIRSIVLIHCSIVLCTRQKAVSLFMDVIRAVAMSNKYVNF